MRWNHTSQESKSATCLWEVTVRVLVLWPHAEWVAFISHIHAELWPSFHKKCKSERVSASPGTEQSPIVAERFESYFRGNCFSFTFVRSVLFLENVANKKYSSVCHSEKTKRVMLHFVYCFTHGLLETTYKKTEYCFTVTSPLPISTTSIVKASVCEKIKSCWLAIK